VKLASMIKAINTFSSFGVYLKACQVDMMIESENSFNFFLFHENEGNTIGKTQAMI